MRLLHLGLPVRDEARSRRFYEDHFGFDGASARRFDDGTVIIQNADGFDLALHPCREVGSSPEFLHFGFRLPHADEVRELGDRLRRAGVDILERYDEPGYVGFKCTDPDGHRVETYWEPATS